MGADFLNPSGQWQAGEVDASGNQKIILGAGTSVAGKVGIDQTTDGTTNKVQAHMNVAGAAQTAANPAPVQSPGFVSSVSQTRPNDTTAYTALDVVGASPAANMQFTSIGSVAGGHVIITGISLRIDVASVPSGMTTFRLHLFDAAPTAIADNSAMNLIAADRSKYLGFIEIPTPVDLGDTCWSRNDNINFKCKLASASTDLYGVLQTVSGFTPSSQTVKTVRISGVQC